MEKENSAVIDRFDEAANSNTIHLTAVEDGKQLKKETSDRRKTMSSNGTLTLESLEMNKDKMDERSTCAAQSQKIWDMLDSGKSLDPKICALVTQPYMKGGHGAFKVEGEKGNGVHALWVLMMRYRACDDKHDRNLRQILAGMGRRRCELARPRCLRRKRRRA